MKRFIPLILLLASVLSLKAEENLFVLNEGLMSQNNGSLSWISNGTLVSNHWFADQNNVTLGDTPNSMIQVNDSVVVVAVNGSDLLQFLTTKGKAVAAIEDIPSPRRMTCHGDTLYVTSYAHQCKTLQGVLTFEKGFVAAVDLTTYKVTTATEVGYEPEGIVYYQGYLVVVNTGCYAYNASHDYESTLSVLEAATLAPVCTIETHHINLYGALSLSRGYLLVPSVGNYYDVDPAALLLDLSQLTSLFAQGTTIDLHDYATACYVLPYPVTYHTATREATFYGIGSSYSYVTGTSVINTFTLDARTYVESRAANGLTLTLPGALQQATENATAPYGLYANPYTGSLYLTDAKNYLSAGTVSQFTAEGEAVCAYTVYINPSSLLALPTADGPSFSGIATLASPTHAPRCYNLQGLPTSHPSGLYLYGGEKRYSRQ